MGRPGVAVTARESWSESILAAGCDSAPSVVSGGAGSVAGSVLKGRRDEGRRVSRERRGGAGG